MGTQKDALKEIIEAYFSDPKRRMRLEKGERILQEGAFNDRLFLVVKGGLTGYTTNRQGEKQKIFHVTRNMFVGVYSFFSKTWSSTATVIAEEKSEVAYIDQAQEPKGDGRGQTLFEQFMPVVMMDLSLRWQREVVVVNEREEALKQLIQTEKLASLGKMAAGLAHELNNAIAVLERNANWLSDRVSELFQEEHVRRHAFFQTGLEEGRKVSSREIRKRADALMTSLRLPEEEARKLAETGISRSSLTAFSCDLKPNARAIHTYWELGASFHDMKVAARHATHVVRSVKALASQSSVREGGFDVNLSIKEALALLGSPLRGIEVSLQLSPLPAIVANKGDLVQVWANLIRNAVEAMSKASTEGRQIRISSKAEGRSIVVRIQDNGPGIAEKFLKRVFEPNFTTKERGLDFGLGLGLTIVQQIVLSYNGEVFVKSGPGKTVFTVKLR